MYMYGCWALAIIVIRYPVSEGSKYFFGIFEKKIFNRGKLTLFCKQTNKQNKTLTFFCKQTNKQSKNELNNNSGNKSNKTSNCSPNSFKLQNPSERMAVLATCGARATLPLPYIDFLLGSSW